MSFQDARWLWLLGLLPILLILVRRGVVSRQREVASLVLWRKALSADATLARATRRPIPPSRLAWIATLAALIFAIAEPSREISGEPRVLVLLEDGARMQARRQDGDTRFAALQKKLDASLAALPACRVSLQTVPGGVSAQGSPAQMRAKLASLAAQRQGCRFEQELAIRHASFAAFDAVLVGSDRELRPPGTGLPPNASLVLAGEPSRNAGWASFYRSGDSIVAVVKNFSAQKQSRTVRFEAEGRVLENRVLDLAPEETREISFPSDLAQRADGRLVLEPADEFALDDALRPGALSRVVRVRVPADIPASLRKAFASIPELHLVVTNGGEPREGEAEIFLRDRPPGSVKPAVLIRLTGKSFVPKSLRHSEDALGRLLGFEGVRVEEASLQNGLSSDAEPLAWASDADGKERPILWREGESLALGFSLEKSDWEKHPSFPVLWAAWVEEIRAKRGNGENFLQPDQSDTNGVSRDPGPVALPPGAGRRREPLSDLFLIVAAISFLLALALESRGR